MEPTAHRAFSRPNTAHQTLCSSLNLSCVPLLHVCRTSGQSVKSRASEMTDEAAAASLLAARSKLLTSLGTVDKYCYKRQMGGGSDSAADAEATSALENAVAALDTIIKLL